MEQLINVGSILGKDMINIADGAFVGTAQGVLINETQRKAIGIKIKQKKSLLSSKDVIPFEKISAFGSSAIMLKDVENSGVSGRNIIGMDVMTADGNFVGKIIDFAFDKNGKIYEYILKDGMMKGLPNDRGGMSDSNILTIGKDVVIAQEGLDGGEFEITDEEIYGSWQQIDEILEDINQDDEKIEEQTTEKKKYEEQFDKATQKINKTFSDVSQKIKGIDTEDLTDRLKVQADKFGTEAMSWFASVKGKVKGQKPSAEQSAAKEEDIVAEAETILQQVQGKNVKKPLIDRDGNVIIWPHQEITKEMILTAIKTGQKEELLESIQMTENESDEGNHHIAAEESSVNSKEADVRE